MRRRVVVLGAILAAQLVMLAPISSARGASIQWSLTVSPLTATEDVQRVFTLTATNEDPLAATESSSEIGCVVVDVPGNFTVAAAAVTGSNAGETWHTDPIVGNRVIVHTESGGDRLAHLDWVRFTVTATPFSTGSLNWNGRAFRQQDCTGAAALVGIPPIVVVTAPTPTPTPAPTPTPTPTPRPTPKTPSPTPGQSLPLPSLPGPVPSTAPSPPSASARRSASPRATTDPSSTPDDSGSVAPPGGGGASGPAGGNEPDGAQQPGAGTAPATGAMDVAPRIDFDETRLDLGVTGFGVFGGISVWSVPAATLGVPGILLIIWVSLQAIGALAWIPAVRRLRGDEPTTP